MTTFTQCHYVKPRTHEQCTGEAVIDDPDDGPLLCQRHLAAVMEFVRDRMKLAAGT